MRDTRDSQHRNDRGSILVIVLLVILALTGLGLIGLRNSTHELRSSANYRFTKQGSYVSQAAMMHTLDKVGQDGETYVRLFKLQRDLARTAGTTVPSFRLHRDDILGSGALLFSPVVTASSCIGWSVVDQNCQGFEGDLSYYGPVSVSANLLPNFAITIGEPMDGPRAPGFGTNFCFKRFTFEGAAWVGGIPPLPTSTSDWRNPGTAVFSRSRAQALVGPLDCSGGYYGG